MAKRKNKYFTASDCIHLHACRKVTAIANRVLYGNKTQKLARGCSKDCPCYCSADELAASQEKISEMAALVVSIKNHFHWIHTECCEGSSDIDAYMGSIEESVDELADMLKVQAIVNKTWDYDRERTISETQYDSPLCNSQFSEVVDERPCYRRLFEKLGTDAVLMCGECDIEHYIGDCKKWEKQ